MQTPVGAKSIIIIGLILAGVLLALFSPISPRRWMLHSPDGHVTLAIELSDGKLTYSAGYGNTTAIESSPLGIVRDDEDFFEDLNLISERKTSIDESYTLSVGKQLNCRNRAKQLVLRCENDNKENIDFIFRAYDDGIAYRYHFSDSSESKFRIVEEKSGFTLPKKTNAWIQPYDMNVRKKPCYETYYENGARLDTLTASQAGWAFPVLVNTITVGFQVELQAHSPVWALITEAGLDETYPATHLSGNAGNTFTIRFPEEEEVTSDADPEPVSTLPWTTPWRVVVIGPSLSTIQESTLVTNLNPPSVIADASWVKPGRSSWSWWSAGATPRDFNIQKAYVDFTAQMGWEYVLVDSGWPQMKGGTMTDLIKYANSKNVGIVLWYHSGMGREKDTLSYANVMAFPEERKKEFAKIRDWGAKGVKVDFFDSDKQPVIKRYMDILRDAADYKIMVNFHGSTLPRGWERTYPHLVSMESVKGAEGAGRQPFCDRAPSHNTILPFTRNAVGSMDYTPVTFTNKSATYKLPFSRTLMLAPDYSKVAFTYRKEAIRRTTFGHELALSVVFESGVFHFADNMKSYQALPAEPKNFLRQVPVAWDETKYVAGIPGKYALVARRKGNAWYVAGINGQAVEQELSFDLPFLKKEEQFTLISDGLEPGTFATRSMKVGQKSNRIKMIPYGGFVLFVEGGAK